MITTLTGNNTYARQQALNKIIAEFVAEHGDLAVERIDGEEADFAHLQEVVNNLPFLATRKLAVLRSPSANKQFVDEAEKLFKEVPETTDLILVEPKLDKRQAYYKFLKTATDFKDFSELDANELSRWLVQRAIDNGGALSAGDARHLVGLVGPDQQMLASELDKLLVYDPKISRDSIDLLVDPTPQSTIFQLLEAAFAGNAKLTLALYKEQRAMKVEPQQIIALLAWQLQILALLKTAGERTTDDIAKEAKSSPYAVKRSQALARKLSLAQVKRFISKLLQIDTKSKTQTYDVDQALQNYLLTIATTID